MRRDQKLQRIKELLKNLGEERIPEIDSETFISWLDESVDESE